MLTAALLLTWFTMIVTPAATDTMTEVDGNFHQETLTRKVRSYYGGMNEAEFKFCANPVNFGGCLSVKDHATKALEEARRRYAEDSLHNGDGDAFRHCYWCARMTRDLGEEKAKGFGDRHEQVRQPHKELRMDLNNNEIGRSVGQSVQSYEAAAEECARLVNAGRLLIVGDQKFRRSGPIFNPNIPHSSVNGPRISPQGLDNKPNLQNPPVHLGPPKIFPPVPQSKPDDRDVPVLLRILPDLPKIFPGGSQSKPNSPPDNSPKVFRLGSQNAPNIQNTPQARPNLFPSSFQNRPSIQHSPISRPNSFSPSFQSGPVLPHSPVSRPSLFIPRYAENRGFRFG